MSLGYVYATDNITIATSIIGSYAQPEKVYAVYLAPKCLFDDNQFERDQENNKTNHYLGHISPMTWGNTILKPSSLNSYVPVNNKLLTYPFVYFNVSNNNGSMHSYRYELFNSNNCDFVVKGIPTIRNINKTCSIKI